MAIVVGTVLGFLSGLGIGGGSLLMLWLTLFLQMPQGQARSLNLLFFLPSAALAVFFRWKQGHISFKTVFPAIVAGCIAAAAASWVQSKGDLTMLKAGFGWLLIVTGARELFYKSKSV